jgi:hypothetical protein
LGPQGSDGLARMVVPGDLAGGRYVSDLVKLDVQSLPEPGPSGPGGISDQLALSGDIADPSIVTPDTLAALNQSTTETATYTSGSGQVTDTYTGVSLWNLIQDAGLLTDPSIKKWGGRHRQRRLPRLHLAWRDRSGVRQSARSRCLCRYWRPAWPRWSGRRIATDRPRRSSRWSLCLKSYQPAGHRCGRRTAKLIEITTIRPWRYVRA